ncbi:His Kinase A (phospho-acceptor) domain-containing protein [Marivirga sericea]|uniref:histidine kinase n=1 Tax=Marivirga sericea TaxID=1028 RepID=A0A1X7ILY6_9BACT|nr:ATP-binding protein [Marivirga sericea]SMG15890.1 His Kinase A (phospho-acceptor) domain-containing protein [Marivirga sericea]
MKYWGEYKTRLAETILGQQEAIQNLSYYRNQLFYFIVLYTLAFSPLAIVPGIIASYLTGFVNLLILNILTFVVLLLLAFFSPIKLRTRKLIFISTLFIIAWTLLYNLQLEGPGLIYLFSVTIVSCLILSGKIAYRLIFVNSVLLTILGLNIEFQWLKLTITEGQSTTTWFGIVVNLIFLSIIIVACFEVIFRKLEKIIVQQRRLNAIVNQDNQKILDAQNVLMEKNEELNQFAHTIAHDLKEPLRSMQAFAHLTISKYRTALPEKGQEFLTYIQTSSERMAALLDSLLDYAQIGKGKEKSVFSVRKLVEELEKDLSQLIRENDATIKYNGLPQIMGYEIEFKLLLQNLLANAIKFKKNNEDIEVKIKANEKDDSWEFLVTDNGIGIEERHQEKIFTIFHRLHRDKFPGTGLGLANCKKIVEIHGGKIWVESLANQGSTFYFTISKDLENMSKNG